MPYKPAPKPKPIRRKIQMEFPMATASKDAWFTMNPIYAKGYANMIDVCITESKKIPTNIYKWTEYYESKF